MKSKYIITGILALSSLSACKKTKEQRIEAFKKELAAQKTKLSDTKSSIKTLEDSLAKLESKADELAMVSVTPITKTSFSHYLDIQARVETDENVLVSSQMPMPGRISRLLVKEGDRVTKGQVIAIIDAETSEKTIEGVKKQLELVTIAYEKQKALWEQKIGTIISNV